MLDATSTRESLCHELVVEESTSCCHPLYLIRADNSSTSCSILMLYLSRVHYSHCLESSMWVESHSRTISVFLRRYTPWSIVIKHDKRTRNIIFHTLSISWKIVRNTKTITYHMTTLWMFYLYNFFDVHILEINNICWYPPDSNIHLLEESIQ